jgi:hypothetical protein
MTIDDFQHDDSITWSSDPVNTLLVEVKESAQSFLADLHPLTSSSNKNPWTTLTIGGYEIFVDTKVYHQYSQAIAALSENPDRQVPTIQELREIVQAAKDNWLDLSYPKLFWDTAY